MSRTPGGLSTRVVSGLKDRVLAGELSPGTRLPSEAELIETYGVSRTVVREAVGQLRAEGLVETHQGRGSFVLALPEPSSFSLEATAIRSRHDVLAMIDFRLGVECEAAALAAARADPAAVAALDAALDQLSATDPEHAVEADFAFHRAIAAATGNRFYLDLLDSLGPMMIMLPRTRLGATQAAGREEAVDRVRREHAQVARAVTAGDPDTARAAMRVHLGNTRRRLSDDAPPPHRGVR